MALARHAEHRTHVVQHERAFRVERRPLFAAAHCPLEEALAAAEALAKADVLEQMFRLIWPARRERDSSAQRRRSASELGEPPRSGQVEAIGLALALKKLPLAFRLARFCPTATHAVNDESPRHSHEEMR